MSDAAISPRPCTTLSDDLALLARLHDREIDRGLLSALARTPVADWLGLKLSSPTYTEAVDLLTKALAHAPDVMAGDGLDDIAAEYAAIYLNHAYRTSPCESVWRDEDGLERQAPMFQVRSWFARYGYRVPDWRLRADDHLAHQLAFLSYVAPLLETANGARPIAEFMREHPLAWAPAFAGRVARRCRSPFYAGVALLTAAYLQGIAEMLVSLYGFDMTPAPIQSSSSAQGPTCADPPPRYAPGPGPGW